MNRILLSNKDKDIVYELNKIGYDLFYTQEVEDFLPLENYHADMQCVLIDKTAFILSCCNEIIDELSKYYNVVLCGENINEKYPNNVVLNAVVLNDCIIAKVDSLDLKLIEYCKNNNYKLIDVNQGYTKCSCVIVNENSIITEDESIYNSLINTNINVLKIKKGFVKLDGAEYGFIGGASVLLDKNKLFFFGDITLHPDYKLIKEFCDDRNVKIEYIKNKDLVDIGGAIVY